MKPGTFCYILKDNKDKVIAKTITFTMNEKDTSKVIESRKEIAKIAQKKFPGATFSLQLVHSAFAGKIEEEA